ncbi:hypothetical protein ACRAWF_24735, partial [Streptomyces sp. L7]
GESGDKASLEILQSLVPMAGLDVLLAPPGSPCSPRRSLSGWSRPMRIAGMSTRRLRPTARRPCAPRPRC